MAEKLKLLTQGAEGRVYTCEWLGQSAVVKQRFPKKYRHPVLDSHITNERIKSEARTLSRCRTIGINVPALYDVNILSNELVIEFISGSIPIRKYIADKGLQSSLLPPLAQGIGKMLSKLHSNDIIHGDLTTSNMLIVESGSEIDSESEPDTKMISESCIYLIDFGLSYICDQAEDKAVDLYVLERAILSTHPNSEELMKEILETYCEGGGKKAEEVFSRLTDVRMRGRKKLCFG